MGEFSIFLVTFKPFHLAGQIIFGAQCTYICAKIFSQVERTSAWCNLRHTNT